MRQYLDLLRDVLDNGRVKDQRAVLKDGTRPTTRAVFGRQVRYDLAAGFPLVTTKRVPFGLVRDELLWFLAGSTSNDDLRRRCGLPEGRSTIWEEWADPDTGDLGPIYGRQWRHWQTPGGGEIDQIAQLVANVRAVAADPHHPAGRRLILTAWNPADIARTRGPMACHTLSQFDVSDGRLSCQLYQRSADLFLGVPFNIACYAILTHLIAHMTGLGVGEFIHSFGDAHLYDNHLDAVRTQLAREPRPLPRLAIDPAVTSLDGIQPGQISLEGYDPHPSLKAEVAV